MAAPSNTNRVYNDVLRSFELGVNSGISPVLLPKNQLAWAINATVRGGHIAPRPAFQVQSLNFGGNIPLQEIVETGYFQGAAVYRPDFGTSQIIASISGRLFAFTPINTTWTVTEITIAGDANDATAKQVWMWQAEKWLIITDGTENLPIFYDGTSCRRSYGPAYTIVPVTGITANSEIAPPAIGSTVTLTLANAYTGPFNVPVLFNGAFYEPTGSLTGNITLENITGTAGAIVPSGSDIVVNPNLIGYTTSAASASYTAGTTSCVIPLFCNTQYTISITVNLTSIGTLAVGNSVTITSATGLVLNWTVSAISGLNVTLTLSWGASVAPCAVCAPAPPPSMAQFAIADNTLVQFASSVGPTVILGQLTANFTNPAVGATDTASMNVAYTGPANTVVTIGTASYVINAVPASGSTTLILINLSDTATANYAAANTLDITSVPELPAGRMGAYGMCRNWICLTDGLSYVASDIVGGAAGTEAHDYRDAVLKITENTFLAGGGKFRLPHSGNIITSMTFVPTLDTSQGQGPLQVGTDLGFFSNNTPLDRTTWSTLTNPIQTQSLIGLGPLAQDSTVVANSDILFRSVEGLGSLIIARRNFGEWGNTPISREVERALVNDSISLLPYGSAINFDNRFVTTCYPNLATVGVFHQGLTALNFDLISTIREKSPPVYDGLWTGLNFLKSITGNFSGTGKAYAFGFNLLTSKIELYELLRTDAAHFDNGSTKIVWTFETPAMFREDIKPHSELVRLIDGELEVKDVDNEVTIQVEYRPDYYPCWVLWREFRICADQTITDGKPGYRTRLSFGDPPGDACESSNNRLLKVGHFFQFRFKITGYCKFMGLRIEATTSPASNFAQPVCAATCAGTLPVP